MGLFHQEESGEITVEQKPCLDCFHCAAACPVGAVMDDSGCNPCAAPAEETSLLSKFQRRRSIRRFQDDTPDRALIQAALDGASWAPSAKNQRLYSWSVVLGKEKVEQLYRRSLVWAKTQPDYRHLVWLDRHGRNPVTCNAPALIFIHCPEDSHNPQTDCAIAMTLAEQLLVDSGLGTCWAGYLCRMVNQCEELRTQLGLPEGHQVYGVLMTGIPNETYPSVPARPAAAVNWVE
jgi:nitroreductase